jgi:predicted O-methyltransferase YrrM
MKEWTKKELEELKQKVNKTWGWSSLEDMDAMIKYCRLLPENPSILEIGTGMGRSALLMALVRPDATIWTVDGFGLYGINAAAIKLHSKTGYKFNKTTKEYAERIWREFGVDNINLIVADSTKLKWEREVDLIFIDGDHSLIGVRKDYKRFSPFLKDNGYLLFHDVLVRAGGAEVFMLMEEIEKEGKWNYKVEANVGILTRK